MLYRSGEMLKSQLNPKPLTAINLLFVADIGTDVNLIMESLQKNQIDFNYKQIVIITDTEDLSSIENNAYDAVVLYSMEEQKSSGKDKLLNIRQWLHQSKPERAPLIVIVSGSSVREDFFDCEKKSLTNCVFTNNIMSLPEILKESLLSSYKDSKKQKPKLTKRRENKPSDRLVHQISKLINSDIEPEEILQEILTTVGESFQVDRIILDRKDRGKIEVEKEWQNRERISSLIESLTGSEEELIEYSYNKQKNEIDKQIKAQYLKIAPRKNNQNIKDLQFHSVLSVPIFVKKLVEQQKYCGTLTLQTISEDKNFSSEDINILETIAEQIAIVLYLREQEKEQKNAEISNQNKTEFIAHISHELRNPLTAILGFARMLSEEIYGSLNVKQVQYINAISDSGKHLLDLVNDLLDLSKIEAEKEELYLETVPVYDICLASIAIVQERAKEQGLELNLEIDSQVSFCLADQRRLKQILVNLLSNAVKFTEVGSVTLKVQQNTKSIEFCVIDTGIGISQSNINKVFEPFTQIKNHLSQKHKGTGLGLPLSRDLARLHGGDIIVTSQKGEGSCFTLSLPM